MRYLKDGVCTERWSRPQSSHLDSTIPSAPVTLSAPEMTLAKLTVSKRVKSIWREGFMSCGRLPHGMLPGRGGKPHVPNGAGEERAFVGVFRSVGDK